MNLAFPLFSTTTLWIVLMSISVMAQQPDDPRHFSKFNIPFFQDRMLADHPQDDLDLIYNKYEQCLPIREPRGEGEIWLFDYDQKKRVIKFTKVYDGTKLIENTVYKEDAKGRLTQALVTAYNHDMTVSELKKSTFTYNEVGDIIAWTTPGEQNTASYDAEHRIISSSNKSNSGDKSYARNVTYRYDEKGRIIETKTFSNYFNDLVSVVYTDVTKDGIRTENAVVTTREIDPITGKLSSKAPKKDQYQTSYDDRNNLVEYHHLGHFANYMFYDNQGLLLRKLYVTNQAGSHASDTRFVYNGLGRVVLRTEKEILHFKSTKDYKIGKLMEHIEYDYQNGKVTRSGEYVGGTYTNQIKCFFADAPIVNSNTLKTPLAQENGVKLLFTGTQSDLTEDQKKQIFAKSGFSVSPDGKQLLRTGVTDTIVTAKTYLFKMGSQKENVFVAYKYRNPAGVNSMKVLFFAYQYAPKSPKAEFQKLYDGPGILPLFNGDNSFYIPRNAQTPVPFLYSAGMWMQMVPEVVKQSGNHIGIDLEEYIRISNSGARQDLSDRLKELREEQQDFVSNKRDLAEKELEQKTAQGKGKSGKFIGKYWQLGDYKTVYTLSKVGANFVLNSAGKALFKTTPKFVFNEKADQLEAWVNDGKIKYKIRIYYDYRNNSIYVGPEDRRLGRSTNLLAYK